MKASVRLTQVKTKNTKDAASIEKIILKDHWKENARIRVLKSQD